MDADELVRVVAALRAARAAEAPRLDVIRRNMLDQATDLYLPKSATAEYRMLVDQARFNVLSLVVESKVQNLFVDGFRPSGPSGRIAGVANSPIWDAVWQPNRMDARQAALFRSAITYGAGFAVVLPGDTAPVITPMSPLRLTALYDDPVVDQWPRFALVVDPPRVAAAGAGRFAPADVRVLDANFVYTVAGESGRVVRAEEHGLGVCPVVRFVDRFDADGWSPGKVEPLLPAQRQLNQTTFSLLMAQQFAAFRQRWATGMAIEEDADGNPKEPWNAAVNAVWQNESPDGRFGDFAETNLDGYLSTRDKILLYVASVAQVPPHNMLIGAGISNISAEALAALESGHRHDIAGYQTGFGESMEQVLRLAGLALGGDAGLAAWRDTSAQVVWRDTTPRSLAQIASALGMLAVQLEIPPRALWERVPGVTDQDLEVWRSLADDAEQLDRLSSLLLDVGPAGGVG